MDESTLITSIIAGRDDYEKLVSRYHVGLIIHCEHILHNRADAEDVAQEAFVKAYLKLADFDPSKSRYSTWLYRIATNLAIDLLRKNHHVIADEDLEAWAQPFELDHIREEECQALRDAVKSLTPPEYRKVIEQYYWQGDSYQDIARSMDVPVNTIRTWIRRAKLKLKGELV